MPQTMVTPVNDTIAGSASVSGGASLGESCLAGILCDNDMSTATATLQGSVDGNAYVPVYNSAGTVVTASLAADRIVTFNPSDVAGLPYARLLLSVAPSAQSIVQYLTRRIE